MISFRCFDFQFRRYPINFFFDISILSMLSVSITFDLMNSIRQNSFSRISHFSLKMCYLLIGWTEIAILWLVDSPAFSALPLSVPVGFLSLSPIVYFNKIKHFNVILTKTQPKPSFTTKKSKNKTQKKLKAKEKMCSFNLFVMQKKK